MPVCCSCCLQCVQVVLHQGVDQEVQLRAYLHALHLASALCEVSTAHLWWWLVACSCCCLSKLSTSISVCTRPSCSFRLWAPGLTCTVRVCLVHRSCEDRKAVAVVQHQYCLEVVTVLCNAKWVFCRACGPVQDPQHGHQGSPARMLPPQAV